MRLEFPDLPLSEIARRVGVNPSTARQAMKHGSASEGAADEDVSKFEVTGDTAACETRSTKVKTLADLLEYLEVDLDVWEVERHVVNKWEVGAKDENKRVRVTQLFQVKAWLRRKAPTPIKDTLVELLAEFKKAAPVQSALVHVTPRPPILRDKLLEVSLFDLHFGKLCWAPEVGQSYDVKLAREVLDNAVTSLLADTHSMSVDRILLPIGNDFFNVDSKHNTTTSGTPQDCDSRWQKSFIAGRKAMVDTIERLRKVAPVDILMVSGNHDTERVFYLGEVLSAWFSKTEDVTVDNSPSLRKYYAWGKCLLGFTHGDKEKHENLPLILATERPEDWARSKFREVHVGHFHKKKEIQFGAVDEFRGVRVRVIPSLCPPDAWHKSMGYEALRSAEAFVWDKERGCVATFSYQP